MKIDIIIHSNTRCVFRAGGIDVKLRDFVSKIPVFASASEATQTIFKQISDLDCFAALAKTGFDAYGAGGNPFLHWYPDQSGKILLDYK